MSEYAILIYEDPAYYATMSPEGWAAVVEAHNTFTEGVVQHGGSITGGGALSPVTTATTITGGTVTDGPFVESKEVLLGYYTVEARDHDHAVELAKLCPATGGGVELRPLHDPSAAQL
ncbi:YciI family protein [uncultured Microbacterium sp.]|uniref:YciI family protein n=1 Tax=uncultured Microbacterium sp. TaxID=191216 RepID=UPI002602C1C2|nr:YciI family protein [uncultured Microbacterium sp.]